jgi:hypothetical protein
MVSFKEALGGALRQIVGPLIGAVVVLYFAYYTVEGDRGLVRLGQLTKEVADADRGLQNKAAEAPSLPAAPLTR